MKVVSINKIKNEQYEVMFNNDTKLILYEDTIVNNGLLNKEIDDKLYDKIITDNEESKCFYLVVKYIEKKIRSKKEIINYLKEITNEETIIKIINRLEKLNLINDTLFATCYSKDKYNISKYGINKIINGLEENDIDENIISNAVSFITTEDQLIRINKIVDKYIKTNRNAPIIKLKNKIYTNLIDKGYPKDLIYEALNNININNDKAILNQYTKLYKKYSKTYDGDELIKIISKELQKYGFNYEDVKKIGN